MKEFLISFKKYRSAKQLVIAYARFDHPRMKEEKLLKTKVGLHLADENGKFHDGKVEELIGIVRKRGCWAFCDSITNTRQNPIMHYWISNKTKNTDRPKIMELFGHETGHAIGYSDEKMATKFGAVSSFSYIAMMEEVFNEIICSNEK